MDFRAKNRVARDGQNEGSAAEYGASDTLCVTRPHPTYLFFLCAFSSLFRFFCSFVCFFTVPLLYVCMCVCAFSLFCLFPCTGAAALSRYTFCFFAFPSASRRGGNRSERAAFPLFALPRNSKVKMSFKSAPRTLPITRFIFGPP